MASMATMAAPVVALMLLAASTVQISAAAAALAAGVDLCAAAAPVHLPTPSSEASVQLGLASSWTEGQPCRLDVTVPASYELAVTLVAAPVAAPVVAAADFEEPEEGDDAYDTKSRFAAALLAQASARRKTTNYGGMLVEAVVEDARGSNANASCTLALYIKNEVAWSVDLCDEKSVQAAKPHIASIPHNLSLTWTPPGDGRALRVAAVALTAVRKGLPTDNFCTVRPVRLAGRGLESAMALELRDDRPAEERVGPCRVRVAAPPGYQLSLVLANTATATATATSASTSTSSSSASVSTEVPTGEPSCRLSLIPGCADALFSVDLCRPGAAASLNYSEWSPNNVTIEWTPPSSAAHRAAQQANTVILTAVARGALCQHAHFTPCQQRPRFQHLCVAAELACDGFPNCPMFGRDEDPGLCRSSAGLIEVPRSVPVANAGGTDAGEVIRDLLRTLGSNRTESHQHDAIPDTLSNYGPWGYLMLGMLVCGAFLMLCGLWECCCRQPKASATATHPSHTPTTVLMPQMGTTGGVLALDSDLEDDPSRPPAYDDLDQPPAYGALFPPGALPGLQPKDVLPVASLAASLAASLDAPFDGRSLSASTSSMTSSMATASSGSSMSLS